MSKSTNAALVHGGMGEEPSSNARTTETSATTPQKALKKSRVEAEGCEDPVKRRLYDAPSDAQVYSPKPVSPVQLESLPETVPAELPMAVSHPGQTGDMPDEVERLRTLNHELVTQKMQLELEVETLRVQLRDFKIQSEGEGVQPEPEQTVPASDDAARKRLVRLCAPNSQGNHGEEIIHDLGNRAESPQTTSISI